LTNRKIVYRRTTIPFRFFSHPGIDANLLREALPSKFSLRFTVKDVGEASILDTFDQELRLSGKLLVQHQGQLSLFCHESAGPVVQPDVVSWRFITDLDDGPVKERLADVSPLRAFLHLQSIPLQTIRLVLLDEEEKTHARAYLWLLDDGEHTKTFGYTQALKGYSKGHRLLIDALKDQGAQPQQTVDDLYQLLGVERQAPYTSKPDIPLKPDDPMYETTRRLIGAYLRVARENEAGICADEDTEFLHDYRVSLRKVRSILSLFKGVYSEEETRRIQQSVSAVMKQTNRLRDLDVYLLDKAEYLSMVPDAVHEGLRLMFGEFTCERQQQFQHVVNMLQSSSYAQALEQLVRQFREQEALEPGARAGTPTLPFARRLIWKRYNKVCKIARRIDAETPDEQLHNLRIQCKKLRYLMEFFAPLFPKNSIKRLIKALKRLQDTLGRFNDFSVQQRSLQTFLHDRSQHHHNTITLAESIGALIAVLHQRQLAERGHILEHFVSFDSPETRQMFYVTFRQEPSG